MVSLGKLSAGLAHELNNPASAIERSAALLEDRVLDAGQAARALAAASRQKKRAVARESPFRRLDTRDSSCPTRFGRHPARRR
jgi:signal transduction histidine kinase